MSTISESTRDLLIIAGPGRSGTSLMAALAARLGYHIPLPEVGANQTNPHGFSGPRWAVNFHKTLLRETDVAIDDGRPESWERAAEAATPTHANTLRRWLEEHFDVHERLVVKDPRLAWFLPLYREAAHALGVPLRVITMLRDPAEILRSRETSYGTRTNENTRAIGWVTMMLGIEERTRDLPRAVIRHDALLTDWRTALTEAEPGLGLALVSAATPAQLDHADELVDPALHRSKVDWDEWSLGPHVRDLTARVWTTYTKLPGVPAEAQGDIRAELDALSTEHRVLYDEAYAIALHRTRARIRAERAKAAERTRAELAAQPPSLRLALKARARRMLTRSESSTSPREET